MTFSVRVGFIPLVDAALLVAARDEGFAENEGLALELVREVSWANIRDKLNVGLFDATHMLAPAAIASSLGLGHVRVPLAIPAALNLNGNAITVSRTLYDDLAAAAEGDLSHPVVSARALAKVMAGRKARAEPPPTFAQTFPFSTHHYQLRLWMRWGGIDPDEDHIRLVVIPPPLMAKSLESGHIDGFCVGAPWNAMTVAHGGATILHRCTQIIANAPEKVLAVRAEAADAPFVAPLVRALVRAAHWSSQPENHRLLARHLARPDILDVPAATIESILDGRLPIGADGQASSEADYMRLDPSATRPLALHGDFLLDQMEEARQVAPTPDQRALARSIFRADLFDGAMGAERIAPPPAPRPLHMPV